MTCFFFNPNRSSWADIPDEFSDNQFLKLSNVYLPHRWCASEEEKLLSAVHNTDHTLYFNLCCARRVVLCENQ